MLRNTEITLICIIQIVNIFTFNDSYRGKIEKLLSKIRIKQNNEIKISIRRIKRFCILILKFIFDF